MKRFIPILILFGLVTSVSAQIASNGPFTLEQSVTPAGGRSSGGTFSLDGTFGQPLAGGFIQGPTRSVYSGFWSPAPLAPTAAGVTISGRVRTPQGQGLSGVRVYIANAEGQTWMAISSSFGYYQFYDIAVGQTYIVSVSSKRYTFSQPEIFLSVRDAVEDLDFVSDPF